MGNLLVTFRSPGCRQNRLSDLPRVTKVITQDSSLGLSGRSPSDVTTAHRPHCMLCPHYTGTNAFPIEGHSTGNPSRATDAHRPPAVSNPRVTVCVPGCHQRLFPHSHPSLLELSNTRHQDGLNHDFVNSKKRRPCLRYRVARLLAAETLLVIWGESVR